MKKILKIIIVVMLSPVYIMIKFIKWIYWKAYELGEIIIEPIAERIVEISKEMYRFWFGGKGKRCKSNVDVEK